MNRGVVALPGQAGRLRNRGCRRIGICVIGLEQRLTTGLAGDAHVSDVIVRPGATNTTGADASVTVAVKNASFVVDGDFVKVEEVTIKSATTLLPDSRHTLDRVVRRRVDGCPSLTAIISGRYENVPFPRVSLGLIISSDIRTDEPDRGASRTAP